MEVCVWRTKRVGVTKHPPEKAGAGPALTEQRRKPNETIKWTHESETELLMTEPAHQELPAGGEAAEAHIGDLYLINLVKEKGEPLVSRC